MCNNCECSPTYLVNSVSSSDTDVLLGFRTTPTLINGSTIKFRIACCIANTVPAGLPVSAVVNVNGSAVGVQLENSVGNLVRSGTTLKTRTTYTAVFGSDPNHLMITKVNGKPCCVA